MVVLQALVSFVVMAAIAYGGDMLIRCAVSAWQAWLTLEPVDGVDVEN